MRADGRQFDELREITFQRDFTEYALGSVLVSLIDSIPRLLALESGAVATECSVCAMALSKRSKTRQECFNLTSLFVGCTLTSTSLGGMSKDNIAIG